VYCAGEKGNISEAIASINQRALLRVAQNRVTRVNACIHENGGHFQHLLLTVYQIYYVVVLRNEHPLFNVLAIIEEERLILGGLLV
jgi:hypothetical protein